MSKEQKPLTEKQLAAKAARVAKTKALAEALVAAQAVLKPPPELSAAGIIKTRAWVAIHRKLSSACKPARPSLERITKLTGAMDYWKAASADEAARMGNDIKGSTL